MDNHMEPLLGIISGTIPLHRNEIFKNLTERELETEFGKALVYLSDTIVFIPRHGKDSRHHILPHLINHQANLKALKDLGVKEVMGVNSTGSLKKELRPGIIVIPDDYLVLSGTPTAIHGKAVHITPILSHDVRKRWIDAARDCGINVIDGGVYWQTTGPRFETKAEIRMMSGFADLVGMTMASEAVIAQELGLDYAALCSVDNYGHGLVERELTLEEILQNARRNTDTIMKIVTRYIERRKG
jgi:5'-methylthioadenosine phosphorylase